MVEVVVGRHQQKWHVHFNALVHRSSRFREELCGLNSNTTFRGPIFLPTEDPAIFRFIVPWIYTGNLDLIQPIHEGGGVEAYVARLDLVNVLCRLFCCGLRLGLRDFTPTVMSLLSKVVAAQGTEGRVLITPDILKNVWRSLGSDARGDELKEYLVECLAWYVASSTLPDLLRYEDCFREIPGITAMLLAATQRRNRTTSTHSTAQISGPTPTPEPYSYRY